MENTGIMKANIVSLDGVKEYTGVSVIHIKSKYYNLLIMEGYTPTIGQIDGTLTIVTDNESVVLSDVHGYYLHKKDVFRFMMKEEG
jgi:hypothetical protein